VEGVQTYLLQCQRSQLRVKIEDRLRSAEAQPPTDGLLQRDQVAIPALSRRVLVLSDHALAQWWLLERIENQHATAADEGTGNVSLLEPVATRQPLRPGFELLSPTGRATEPEGESKASRRNC